MKREDRNRPWRRKVLAALLLAAFLVPGLYNGLRIVRYTVDAAGISQPIRLVLVTDLHSCAYGEREEELVAAIRAQSPDLLLLVGDIFDDKLPDDNTTALLEAVAGEYPCYYVTGNHEYWSGKAAFSQKMAILERCGVVRLSNEAAAVPVKGATLTLCGIDDPDAFRIGQAFDFEQELARIRALAPAGDCTILLSHRPEAFAEYARQGYEVVLCGHAHGGQWRIPCILNGLYAPHQGLFPPYAGGEYHTDGTTMLVSRGLARESTRIPRFYNRPELVVIDLV